MLLLMIMMMMMMMMMMRREQWLVWDGEVPGERESKYENYENR